MNKYILSNLNVEVGPTVHNALVLSLLYEQSGSWPFHSGDHATDSDIADTFLNGCWNLHTSVEDVVRMYSTWHAHQRSYSNKLYYHTLIK